MNDKEQERIVEAHPEKCFACLNCQMRCSLRLYDSFNPLKAAIQIKNSIDGPIEILFTDSCENCGTCAMYCGASG